MLPRLPIFVVALAAAMPAAAQRTPADDALQRVRDSRAARAADGTERAGAVRDLLRPNGSVNSAVRSGTLYERQVLVGRSLTPPAKDTVRRPQPVITQPVDTLLIPQGKPFGRTPPRQRRTLAER
ncbi:hypothetical protein OMW55_09775 [Sphingomonas sp. BN140010]|uniref:Uncharacterized protein n=1 Tax=Sphingomonas arvum TaxID=2992113 RepID=A0ABT3JGG9_9SPHN|nr:hypothetical protein [Sphingomonas sp. BN140010]MCW3798091.1 hypothetical protein [Sphingomonas sp. BN140010]